MRGFGGGTGVKGWLHAVGDVDAGRNEFGRDADFRKGFLNFGQDREALLVGRGGFQQVQPGVKPQRQHGVRTRREALLEAVYVAPQHLSFSFPTPDFPTQFGQ